jgi:hypothetical protein
VETIDACADSADQAAARIRSAIEALQTLPFFGGAKLVWLKSANFLSDDKLSRSAAVQEALEALCVALEGDLGGGEVKFLLSAPEVDKRRSFYKAIAKRAELREGDAVRKLDAVAHERTLGNVDTGVLEEDGSIGLHRRRAAPGGDQGENATEE